MSIRSISVTAGLAMLLLASHDGRAQSARKPAHRLAPIHPMTDDVEVLYGDPEKSGEPFVMRIRELPGGIIPPHRHPVDENITVVQGRSTSRWPRSATAARCRS